MMLRKRQLQTVLVAVILLSLITLPLILRSGERYVGVFYYAWQFKDWLEENDPDVYPLIGRYNFGNETALRKQFGQMMDCGIDFVILSWCGLDDLSLGFFYNIVKETDLKFAVMYEYNYERKGRISYLQESADFIYENYGLKHHYFSLYGKPLFYIFTQFDNGAMDLLNFTGWNDNRFTVRHSPLMSPYNNIFTPNIPGLGPLGRAQAYTSDFVSVCPGAEWHSSDGYHTFDVYMSREHGDTYREQWDFAISVGKLNPYKKLTAVICSWNEYTEKTYIEPTEEHGYLYLDITKEKVLEFKQK